MRGIGQPSMDMTTSTALVGSGIYQETGSTTWGNVVIQATNTGADVLYFVGRYSNTAGPFTLALGAWYKLPDWLVPGLTVGQIIGNASVPAGPKVQSVTNTMITLNHPISGSLVDNNGISFLDGSGRRVGCVLEIGRGFAAFRSRRARRARAKKSVLPQLLLSRLL